MFDGRFTLIKLNYQEARKHGAGYVVGRDIFAGCHRWRIDFYPFGLANDAHDDDDRTSVLLFKLKSDPRGVVRAVLEAAFFVAAPKDAVNQHPCASPSHYRDVHAFQAGNEGCPLFLKREHVEDVRWAFGTTSPACWTPPPARTSPFSVGGETFRAPRAVLAARSPVLHAELFGPMADAKAPSITVHEIEPAVFRLMLRFIYKDALPGDDGDDDDDAALGDSPTETMRRLLVAADRYALDQLKLLCARWLWDNISVETFASTLACAETFNCPELRSRKMSI
ncbi:hypothetical protein BS78_07G194900 [Paspalum vaginatum]|nr:hypothetical protein BS78_07G194900 [Paspalum vaginatum]